MITIQQNSMIRTIITSEGNEYKLQLPDDFIGKRVEVIAFVLDEEIEVPKSGQRTFEAIELDTKSYKFNREEANER